MGDGIEHRWRLRFTPSHPGFDSWHFQSFFRCCQGLSTALLLQSRGQQRLNSVDRTHLVLASGKLVLQKEPLKPVAAKFNIEIKLVSCFCRNLLSSVISIQISSTAAIIVPQLAAAISFQFSRIKKCLPFCFIGGGFKGVFCAIKGSHSSLKSSSISLLLVSFAELNTPTGCLAQLVRRHLPRRHFIEEHYLIIKCLLMKRP